MSEVAASVHPGAPIAVLSGPTFAHEVAVGLPTAVTLACAARTLGDAIAARPARPPFRPYLSDDVTVAEIGGAVRDVLALGWGRADAARRGQNGRAALVS